MTRITNVGLRFPEGVNVVIAAALAGPGLDATHVRVMRPPRECAGRTMGFTARSRVGVFELVVRPRVICAEDIHTVESARNAAPRDRGDRRRLAAPGTRAPRDNQADHAPFDILIQRTPCAFSIILARRVAAGTIASHEKPLNPSMSPERGRAFLYIGRIARTAIPR